MGLVDRFVASKHLRTVQRAGEVDPAALEEAKRQLTSRGSSILLSIFDLFDVPAARPHAKDILLKVIEEKTVPAYIEALSSPDRSIADGVQEVLTRTNRLQPTKLLAFLGQEGASRSRILTVLEARCDEIPPSILVSAVETANKDIRGALIRILNAHKSPESAHAILPLLTHDDWWLRLHGILLVGRHPSDEGITLSISRLADKNRQVRLQAVQTLSVLDVRPAIPQLCQALRDKDLKVHSAAIEALIKMGDPAAVPHLVDVLKDESEYARRGAVEVLNEVATTQAIQDLLTALRDEDWWVRVRAADALGTLGGPKVVEAVLQLMKNDDVFIRRYAVEILNSIPDKRAVDHLLEALGDDDWWVRERSIDALGKTKDERAVEPLIRLMTDQAAAPLCARALGDLGDERAIDPLYRVIELGNEEARREAINALIKISKGDVSTDRRDAIQEFLQTKGFQQASGDPKPLAVQGRRASTTDPEVGRPKKVIHRTDLADSPRPAAGTPGPSESSEAPPAQEAPAPSLAPVTGDDPSAGSGALNLADLQPDTLLANRYRMIRRIGGGGFGHVYLAEDMAIREELVLKLLSPQISMDGTMIERFVHELKLTRRITHKTVIRLYDFIEFNGFHGISMEYFPGRSLASILHDEGRLGIERGLRISSQICEGLQAAHSIGIIHRDIKPPNTLIGPDDSVKIVDFGLASMVQSPGSRLTKSGILIGTPYYMSPEQISGSKVGVASDIYSLGAMMYEMFTGSPPYQGDTAVNIIYHHLHSKVPMIADSLPEVPGGLSRLVSGMMAKAVDERPESIDHVLEEIQTMIQNLKAA